MRLKIKFNTGHKRTGKEMGICTNKHNNILFICTATCIPLKSNLRACTPEIDLQLLIYYDIYIKLSLYL